MVRHLLPSANVGQHNSSVYQSIPAKCTYFGETVTVPILTPPPPPSKRGGGGKIVPFCPYF